ncbi:MAG TPA: ribonuclease Z [Cyclobacteriaceae bacterium]|nr:ribonuclease Z [Cyclobacteriaceae bacterium]
MNFKLTILGSSGALPAYDRHPSAQLLEIDNKPYLVDCGEGTQVQIKKYYGSILKIDHVFISHLHGDHYLGLMGFIFSMHLFKREKALHIYAPKGLDELITLQLRLANSVTAFDLVFHELNTTQAETIFETDKLIVRSFPVLHKIPTLGFLFHEKPKERIIDKDRLPPSLKFQQINALKKGEDIVDEAGNILFKNEALTLPPKKSRSYAYMADTRYSESLKQYVQGVDMLYHEATFMEPEKDKAEQTMHSTATEAATFAQQAAAAQLIIGHFSARYKSLEPLLNEARSVFSNTALAIEGKTFELEA